MVNRIWYYHFGRGLVETPSDFGYNGGRSSHPELLDYLATRFIEGGWRIKDLHRLIVTSATYRQASQVHNEPAEAIDADNQLLWRANRRRLEGEALRDASLAVSGALNRRVGGPSYRDMKSISATITLSPTRPASSPRPRTVARSIACGRGRESSHARIARLPRPFSHGPPADEHDHASPVALDDERYVHGEMREKFAGRVPREAGDDAARQTDLAWRLAFSRPPNDRERKVANSFVTQHGLNQLCLVLFNANEFLFVN